MRRLLATAALLLASSAAQAQYQFEYGGRTIRIDPDRGTISIPGVYDNTGRKSSKRARDQDSSHGRPATQDARTEPQPQPAPAPAPADAVAVPPPAAAAPAPAAPPPAAVATTPPQPSPATSNNPPPDASVVPPPAPAPLPPTQQSAAPPPAAPAPTIAAAPPAPPPPAVRRDPNSPVGLWLTEEKEGKVRIEQCGANLCGYSVDAKSNANGEQVLINMRPGQGKWTGRIIDPNTGSTYDSTIALKGADTLRVQGCAFGGMFCGGQTWTRLN